MLAEIVLSAGTSRVKIGEIPALFADAIYPALNEGEERQIRELKKFPLNEKNKREWCGVGDGVAFPVRLTDSDIDDLHKGAWHALPRVKLPILESAWQPYRIAFQSIEPMGWRLILVYVSPYPQRDWDWGATESDYRRDFKKACLSGMLVPYDPTTLRPRPDANGETFEACFVTVEGLRLFAAESNIKVTVEETIVLTELPLAAPPKLDAQPTNNPAVAAEKWVVASMAVWPGIRDLFPTQSKMQIAAKVHLELKRLGVAGRSRTPSAETIARRGMTGWEAKK